MLDEEAGLDVARATGVCAVDKSTVLEADTPVVNASFLLFSILPSLVLEEEAAVELPALDLELCMSLYFSRCSIFNVKYRVRIGK